jgi:hypothetical protein
MNQLNEIQIADFVKSGAFETPEYPRSGLDGMYALKLAWELNSAGVTPAEYRSFCDELAGRLGLHFGDIQVAQATREIVRDAAERWESRCHPLFDLLTLAASVLHDGKSLAKLILHLYRAADQLALLANWSTMETA